MNLILKDLGREEEIAAIYVAASAAQPWDANLLKQLFGVYARQALPLAHVIRLGTLQNTIAFTLKGQTEGYK